VRRREFIKLIGGAAVSASAANAQQSKISLPVVGALWPGKASAPTSLRTLETFREGLRQEGYVEDQNVIIQNRYADDFGGLEKTAEALVALNVNVILATGTPAARAAKHATQSIPIVGASMADPVADGLIASLAQPGGNVTGNTFLGPELEPKRLQLLGEVVPTATHIAVLQHPGVYGERTMRNLLANIEAAAKASRLKLQIVSANGPNDFDSAFEAMVTERADAFIVLPSPMFYLNYRRLVDLAATHLLPAIYVFKEAVEGGGLMSYGADIPDLSRRASTYVAKILKGAKPFDLPVEQPVKFDLAVNLKTAKALGITVPQSLLVAADEVIE
jgi:ABC-type uncharacterized transport system substrate-binding protein